MFDRQAATVATAISETSAVSPELARLQGIALAGVLQILTGEAGRRPREGQTQDQIADGLGPAIETILTASPAGQVTELSRLTWTIASEACFIVDIAAIAAAAIRAEAADALAPRPVNPSLRACVGRESVPSRSKRQDVVATGLEDVRRLAPRRFAE